MLQKIKQPIGRPPLKTGQITKPFTVRLTDEQRARVESMGGADWLRALIDRQAKGVK